jgi:ubiquinone/menaquinone biosynthesis C-methylase UbiE
VAAASSEAERVKAVYWRYDASERAQRKRDPSRPGVQHMRSERWRVTGDILGSRFPGAGVQVLDVGCGEGDDLARMHDLLPGAKFFGIDLSADRIARARRVAPGASLWVGDGKELPFPDQSVHLVVLATVLSSIRDPATRRSVAAETYRVVREDGLLLVYDIRFPSPWNPNVRPVGRRELRALFPAVYIRTMTITLLPPLARGPCHIWPGLYRPMARIPPLRSHYLAVVTRPAE